jgi:hypothetical protein
MLEKPSLSEELPPLLQKAISRIQARQDSGLPRFRKAPMSESYKLVMLEGRVFRQVVESGTYVPSPGQDKKQDLILPKAPTFTPNEPEKKKKEKKTPAKPDKKQPEPEVTPKPWQKHVESVLGNYQKLLNTKYTLG